MVVVVVANDRFPNSHSGDRASDCDSASMLLSVSVSPVCSLHDMAWTTQSLALSWRRSGAVGIPTLWVVGLISHACERIAFVGLGIIDSNRVRTTDTDTGTGGLQC